MTRKINVIPKVFIDGIECSLLEFSIERNTIPVHSFDDSWKTFVSVSSDIYRICMNGYTELTCSPKLIERIGDDHYLYGVLYDDYPTEEWKVACASAYNGNLKNAIYKYRINDPFWQGEFAKGFQVGYALKNKEIEELTAHNTELDDRIIELESKLDDYDIDY